VKASQNEGVMNKKIKLILPYPPSELLPNKKSSWRTKMRVSRNFKQLCLALLVEQDYYMSYLYMDCQVTLDITFIPPSKKMADYDSLFRALKPGIDAIVDASIIKDDSPKYIKKVTLQMGKPDKEHPHTEVIIERL